MDNERNLVTHHQPIIYILGLSSIKCRLPRGQCIHACSAQCWLCSHAALSPRYSESKMILVHSGHSRQFGKWSFLSGQKKHKLIAVVSFLTLSAGRLMTMFFPLQMTACPPIAEMVCSTLYPTAASRHGTASLMLKANILLLSGDKSPSSWM